MFTGDVYEMRVFPFRMKEWERKIMTDAYERVASSFNAGVPSSLALPLWFRAWLALRTAWANRITEAKGAKT